MLQIVLKLQHFRYFCKGLTIDWAYEGIGTEEIVKDSWLL